LSTGENAHHLPSQDPAVLVDVGVDDGTDDAQVERVVIDGK
jgi:hypothetical protein